MNTPSLEQLEYEAKQRIDEDPEKNKELYQILDNIEAAKTDSRKEALLQQILSLDTWL